jgi:hypothetical protein
MRPNKRFEVSGEDMLESTGAAGNDGAYHLAWFDELDDALAYAEQQALVPHDGASAELCDAVRVYDHDRGQFVFYRQRPPSGGAPQKPGS